MAHQLPDRIIRYIAEYSNQTDTCIARHPLRFFDLNRFQEEFGIVSPDNPMLDRYPIFETSTPFLAGYLQKNIAWNFLTHSYYLESEH